MAQQKYQNSYSLDSQVREINRRFGSAVEKLGRDRSKGSKRYQMEVEFAYLLNEIQNSASYIIPMLLEQAREMIDTVNSFA